MACNVSKATGFSEKALKAAEKEFNSLSIAEQEGISNSPEMLVVAAINTRGLTVNGEKAVVLELKPGKVVYASTSGVKLEADLADQTVEAGNKRLNKTTLDSLMSDASFVQGAEQDYTLMSRDIVNEPMKMLELAEELDALSPEADRQHADVLTKLVGKLSTTFKSAMPKISVLMNEKADRNGGLIKVSEEANVGQLYLNIGPGKSYMSALEVYSHELVHAATAFVLKRKDAEGASVRSNIRKIRSEFLNNDNTLAMLTNELGSEKEALELMNYLAGGSTKEDMDTGLEEFVAYSQTNKPVMKVLKSLKTGFKDKEEFSSLAEKLAYYVSKIFNVVKNKITGMPSSNDYDSMVFLTERLMQANNTALHKKKLKLSARLFNYVHDWNDKIAARGKEFLEKRDNVVLLKENTSTLGKIGFVTKLVAKSFISENARRQTAMLFTWGTSGYLDETSTLQSVVAESFENDRHKELAEGFAQEAGNFDRKASEHRQVPQIHILEAFGEPLTKQDSQGLNVILDTDLTSLADEFDIGEIVTSKQSRDAAVKELKKRLPKDTGDRRYFNEQVRLLGRYMVTGKTDIALLKNAYAIANMTNDKTRRFKKKADDSLIDTIDKLATLEALNWVEESHLDYLNDLSESSPDGLEVFLDYVENNKLYARENLFKGEARLQEIKGYRSPDIDIDIETKVAPLKDAKKLEKQGFKLAGGVLDSSKYDSVSGELGYFVNTMPTRTRWHRGALALDKNERRGMSIKESHFVASGKDGLARAENNIKKLETVMMKKLADVRTGTFNSAADNVELGKVTPVMDSQGKVVDFAYEMDRAAKIKYLGVSEDPVMTVGNTKASNWKKVALPSQNKKIIDTIKEENKYGLGPVRDGIDRVVGANLKSFRWVGPDSTDPKMLELWQIMPPEIRKEFTVTDEDSKETKGFYIRSDVLHTLTGYNEFALTDTKAMQKLVPQTMLTALKVAGKIWKSIVAIYKANILLRIPEVLFANVFSNTMFMLIYMKNPKKVLSYQLKGVEAITEYVNMVKKQVRIETKHRVLAQKVKNATGNEKARLEKEFALIDIKLKQSNSDIKNSEVAPLVDEGFYTQILEDLEVSESGNIVKDTISSKLDKAPSLVRNGLEWVWLSDKNPVTKFMHTSTQFSDFVARYAHYNLMKENGKTHNDAIKTVRGMFVNYNVPSSPLVEWSNQMGFVMFTKYFTRIQRALGHLAKANPVGLGLTLVGQEALFDVPDPTDSYFLFKDVGNIFNSPIDSLVGAATPGAYLFTKDLM